MKDPTVIIYYSWDHKPIAATIKKDHKKTNKEFKV